MGHLETAASDKRVSNPRGMEPPGPLVGVSPI
jgi:hypothetical protein